MNKSLKIILFSVVAFVVLSVGKTVNANSIEKISMDIFVDDSGNATVQEVWNCNTNQGTEVYHPYYNIGNSKITDLNVSENGKTFTNIGNWDTSKSIKEKANKCGINKESNGVELCWGMSSYGSHIFNVNYKITNFVSELTDSQMIYWTLIPQNFSTSIGKVYIKIHTNFNIANSVGVWGYGNYGGTAYVYNGYIEMQSKNALGTDEYMTILVQFPKGTFNCKNKLNYDFDYYHNMAEEGSVKYNEEDYYGETENENFIKKISMDIFVDDSGNATVKEVWNCDTNQGTEVYHPYYNIGNSKITDLNVSENGKTFTNIGNWDTSKSIKEKANKCGINKESNGVELCWGMSSYGSHIFNVNYKITNFVSELTDSQMIYWTLIPQNFSTSIGKVYIKIHTNFNIANSVGVWGYGNYGGTAYVYNGYIEMQSKGALDTDEYMTILVQFPKGTFNCQNKLNDDFNYYHNMAEEGSVKYNKDYYGDDGNNGNMDSATSIRIVILICFFIGIIFLLRPKEDNNKIYFGKKKKVKEVSYYRDIPCEGNLYRAFFIGYDYGIIPKRTDIFGAIILKWIKEKKVTITKEDSNKVFGKEKTVIIFDEQKVDKLSKLDEQRLYNILYVASKDGVLESKEFQKWCNDNYRVIEAWFDRVINSERKNLISTNKIEVKSGRRKYVATNELKQEAEELLGLKRFLLEYTLIGRREPIEVKLFEEYLVFAQMMGIAEQVAKEFKELYPEIIEQSSFDTYENIIRISTYSTNYARAVDNARKRDTVSEDSETRSRANDYSSGGGGFSSGGRRRRLFRWWRWRRPEVSVKRKECDLT